MNFKFHTGLTPERWRTFSWDKRLLNIAAELMRAKEGVKWRDEAIVRGSLERALELIDLTVEAGMEGKTPEFLGEFLRFREVLAGFYINPEKREEEIDPLILVFFDLDPVVHNLHLQI